MTSQSTTGVRLPVDIFFALKKTQLVVHMVAAKKSSVAKSKATKAAKPKKQRKLSLKVLKQICKRNRLLRGVKSPWILYCLHNRKVVSQDNPGMSFGEICKRLSPMWREMSAVDKEKYVQMHLEEKKRFEKDVSELPEEQMNVLYSMAKGQKAKREFLSPYMYFVRDVRASVAQKHPDYSFADIGRELGSIWKKMSEVEKAPYMEKSAAYKTKAET